MNKKLLCLLISSFLLSGCANFKKINANELAAERDAQKATEYAKKIRNNPVIQDSTKQWINTTPIIEKQVKQSAPPCPIVINTRSDIELRQIAQRITQTCHIPVRISADVWTYLNGTGTGSTQQMTGSMIVNKRNNEMSRQVVLNVEILSIKKSSQEQAGIDWNAVFNDGHLGLSLGGSFGDAAENVITSGVSIVDGKLAGSKAFLKALSSQGSVSVVTQNSAVTKNLTPVPMQIANQQGFIESVTTDSTANVGSSTSLNAATITTGFNMTLLPYIQPDSQNLQLLFSMSLSDKPTFEVFESGGSKAQTPNVDLKTINQTIDLKSGQTVILSGFQQSNRKTSKQGVITPSFFGLGGGVNSEDGDTILVVLITPNVLNSGSSAVIKNVN